jgi:hypothetical protein
MKKFLLAICTFICLIVNAQLDNEHWFAPMSASSLQGNNPPQCFLYLSTNETTPFSVQVSNNNIVYSTVQVSKNNPVQITIPSNFMIASTPTTCLPKIQWDYTSKEVKILCQLQVFSSSTS